MYVITAHQRHRHADRQTDVKRSHDRYIAKACSGKNCDFVTHLALFNAVADECNGIYPVYTMKLALRALVEPARRASFIV